MSKYGPKYTYTKKTFIPNEPKKKKQKKSEKVLFFVLVFLIIFWSFASVLAIYNHFSKNSSSSVVAYADESSIFSSFSGSNLLIPVTEKDMIQNDNYVSFDYLFFEVNFNNFEKSDTLTINFNYSAFIMRGITYSSEVGPAGTGNNFYFSTGTDIAINTSNGLNKFEYKLSDIQAQGANTWTRGYDILARYYTHDGDTEHYTGKYFYGTVVANFQGRMFDSEVSRIDIGSNLTGDIGGYNFVRYSNISGQYLEFRFRCVYSVEQTGYSPRTYYLSSQGGVTTDEERKSIYQDGFRDGKASAENDIDQSNIYKQGYNAGKSEGYTLGYNQGAESAGNYTFLGLLASVIDAPIQAVTGLLNFDLLGFNMAQFFFSLLTLALIIFIVRLIL